MGRHSRVLVLVMVVVATAMCVQEQPKEVPMEKMLKGMQVKLTYLGEQEKVIPSVGFAVESFELGKFKPFYTKGVDYGNDDVKINTFTVSVEEMGRVYDVAFRIEAVKNPRMPDAPVLSFMVYDATDKKVHEAVLGRGNALKLVDALIGSLDPANTVGIDYLESLKKSL
jgi:hypothetical protein